MSTMQIEVITLCPTADGLPHRLPHTPMAGRLTSISSPQDFGLALYAGEQPGSLVASVVSHDPTPAQSFDGQGCSMDVQADFTAGLFLRTSDSIPVLVLTLENEHDRSR